ncbi:MAG TPA: hypothetical protein VF278_01930 [Pirellulales bacterium]
MNSRPVAHPHSAPDLASGASDPATQPGADGAQKTWHLDEPNSLPAPIIRANMISFRRSYQGRVKVAFFERD